MYMHMFEGILRNANNYHESGFTCVGSEISMKDFYVYNR